jgi:hypothetical protein
VPEEQEADDGEDEGAGLSQGLRSGPGGSGGGAGSGGGGGGGGGEDSTGGGVLRRRRMSGMHTRWTSDDGVEVWAKVSQPSVMGHLHHEAGQIQQCNVSRSRVVVVVMVVLPSPGLCCCDSLLGAAPPGSPWAWGDNSNPGDGRCNCSWEEACC